VKPLLLVLYLIVVVTGAALVNVRSSEQAFDYRAARALPRDHRVQASDLRAPDLAWVLAPALRPKSEYEGRYLESGVPVGEPVKMANVKDRPAAVPAPGQVAYGWLLRESEKQWQRTLDVGWVVDLCDEKCPVTGAPVLAVDCAGEASACAVMLQLAPDQAKSLLAYPGKQKLNIVVGRVDTGGRR
jgi:hypothetical protein